MKRIAIAASVLLISTIACAEDAVISLANIEPESVVESLNKIKSASGYVLATPGSNKIVVNDTPENIAKMKRYISVVDSPRKQVMIEARIMEVTDDFSRSLGINWGVHSTDNGRKFPAIQDSDTSFGGIASIAAPAAGVSGLAGIASDLTFGVIGKNVQINMRINAAASADLLKVISSPKIATISGKPAKIMQGKDIPYVSSTNDKVETKFVEAALALEVIPTVRDDGKINLAVVAKNDAPEISASYTPPINRKQATTELVLTDGQTMVIGGIMVDTDNKSNQGVPWLKDIPVLGHLFKSSTTTKTKRELIVMITPKIMID